MKKIRLARLILPLVAAIMIVGALIIPFSRSHAAGIGEHNAAQDPCEIVTTLQKGQTVVGTVRLNTSDPNENGEGEGGVQVSDNEGNSSSFAGFAINHPFQFTATSDGDVVGACFSSDGDETLTLQFRVGSSTPLSLAQKEALSNSAQTLSNFGTFFGVAVGVTCLVVTSFAGNVACLVVGAGIPYIIGLQADRINNIAKDPSDPNCTIDHPAQFTLPTFSTAQGLTPSEATAANAVVNSMSREIALENSLFTSLNRYQGAIDAGSKVCASVQLSTARGYAQTLAALLKAEPNVLSAMSDAFTASGFPTLTVTPADVSQFEANIAANGFSSQATNTLTQLGANSDDISEIEQLFFVQDPTVIESIGGGKFPQGLTDLSVTNSFLQAAQALEQFALTL